MKTIRQAGKTFRNRARRGAILASACLIGAVPVLADDPKKSPPAAETATEPDVSDLVNWIQVGVGGSMVKGNQAQFQQQKGVRSGPYGGIEAFHFETPVAKKGLFTIEGRGIFDQHDYSVKMELSHPDRGYLRVGYTEFREYYDGTGGYYPAEGLIYQGLFDNRLATDRSHVSFEAGLTLPDKPVVIFRYDYDVREGTKDTTIWGEALLADGTTVRKIVPSFRTLDEVRHSLALDVKHGIGNTEFGLGGRYEMQRNQDLRTVVQRPDKTTTRLLTQDEGLTADMFNVHAFTDTTLSETWRFTTGYSYTTLHSALSGSRLNTPIGATPLSGTDTRYANLGGGSDLNQYVLNLSLMNTPGKNWYIVPAVRVEKQDTKGIATDNAVTGAPVQVVSPATTFATSDKGALYVTESLDVRYTGITNWAFYTRMEFSEDQADLSERFGANLTLPATLFRATEWSRLQQKYTLGANWYPTRKANFAAQYYHKISDNNYHHNLDSSPNTGGGDRYPGYFGAQRFDVDDVNFRLTWHPLPLLTLVSRYDYQLSRVNTRPEGLPAIESGVNEQHMFAQSISWTPWHRLYLQGSGHYVLDTTHSPVEDLTGAASGIVLSAPNKYWTASAIVGFALDNKTDLQTTYSYYRADNYVDNSPLGMPYGSGARQHEVGATLGRQMTRNLRWTLRYAFSKYQDETSGGALNYEAHGIWSTMQYRF
jgi:hypothetical protein